MMSKINLKEKLVNIIYPIDCLECSEEGEWLCRKCIKKHWQIKFTNCFICSKAAQNGICNKCQKDTALDGVISLLPYSLNSSLQLIYNAKYYGYHDAIKFIASSFKNRILRMLPENIQHITFVPTSQQKQKERGYNPAEVVAKTLASEDIEVLDIFSKTKETPSQTKLTKTKRKKNVKGAFRIKVKNLPERLIIADDVITTGSTMRELAILAKKKGVKEVWAITICHG